MTLHDTFHRGRIFSAATIAGLLTFSAAGQDTFPIPPDPTDPAEVRPTGAVVVEIPMERLYAAWSERPLNADALSAAIPQDSIHLYRDANFRDDVHIIDNVSAAAAGEARGLEGSIEDSMTSLRWNLPPGVVVVLYEDDGGRGERLTLWGSGEANTVTRWNFNDKASSWGWYYTGGYVRASEVMERGLVVWPYGTQTAAVVLPAGHVSMFPHKDFDGEAVTITPIGMEPAGALNKVPAGMNDKITSLRWNLPPGVVMMLYQDGDGRKQQASIWGRGEVRDVDAWDFNDKISRWSWHYIGSPQAEVVGYVPPVVEERAIIRERVVVPEPGAFRGAIDLVGRSIEANKLGVTASDLSALRNPTGEGTFVYVPRTQFEGVQRHVVWMVVDDRAYAVTGPAKMITPDLSSAADAEDATWSKTGLSKINAETDAIKIVFVE